MAIKKLDATEGGWETVAATKFQDTDTPVALDKPELKK
jgi:hypothetical protein